MRAERLAELRAQGMQPERLSISEHRGREMSLAADRAAKAAVESLCQDWEGRPEAERLRAEDVPRFAFLFYDRVAPKLSDEWFLSAAGTVPRADLLAALRRTIDRQDPYQRPRAPGSLAEYFALQGLSEKQALATVALIMRLAPLKASLPWHAAVIVVCPNDKLWMVADHDGDELQRLLQQLAEVLSNGTSESRSELDAQARARYEQAAQRGSDEASEGASS